MQGSPCCGFPVIFSNYEKEVYYIMAVPKRKTSKARRDKRRANWKLSVPGMVKCPACGEFKMPHRACKTCGSYKGKEVISVEA